MRGFVEAIGTRGIIHVQHRPVLNIVPIKWRPKSHGTCLNFLKNQCFKTYTYPIWLSLISSFQYTVITYM